MHFRIELLGNPLTQLDAGRHGQMRFSESTELLDTQVLKGITRIFNPLPVKNRQLPVTGPERGR